MNIYVIALLIINFVSMIKSSDNMSEFWTNKALQEFLDTFQNSEYYSFSTATDNNPSGNHNPAISTTTTTQTTTSSHQQVDAFNLEFLYMIFGNRSIICLECDRPFTSYSMLRTHLHRTHYRDISYPCGACDKQFQSQQDVNKHIVNHHNSYGYYCPFVPCTKKYSALVTLKTHLSRQHKQLIRSIFMSGAAESRSTATSVPITHLKKIITITNSHNIKSCSICFYCTKLFQNTAKMEPTLHAKCYNLFIPLHKNQISAHNTTNASLNREFECLYCTAVFSDESSRDNHINLYHKGFSCIFYTCPQLFSDYGAWLLHIRHDHQIFTL